MAVEIRPTGKEVFFPAGELIVSKTDLKGRITYANSTFCHIAGYSEAELLGQPHSIIRHPDMPRAVFRLVWDTIAAGREIFGYVKNMARSGDHYWVFAHVTPSFDAQGNIVALGQRQPQRPRTGGIVVTTQTGRRQGGSDVASRSPMRTKSSWASSISMLNSSVTFGSVLLDAARFDW